MVLTAILSGGVALIGLITIILLYISMKKLMPGPTRNLFLWIYLTVLCCGFPYALWNLLVETNLIQIADPFLKMLPGYILVSLFFIFILVTAFKAKKLANLVSFKK